MRNSRLRPLLIALGAWFGAVALVLGGYAIWSVARGVPFDRTIARDAALMALPLALILAWRDRNRAQ